MVSLVGSMVWLLGKAAENAVVYVRREELVRFTKLLSGEIKPRGRGGRKLGSGAYTAQDRVLWEKMKSKMDDDTATSPWDAARYFAEHAMGNGNFDSKRRRLAEGYKRWISTQ